MPIMPNTPRILFTAPYSAGGKTTVTCGFLRLLQNRGLKPAAFKCGPDYVDAAYHKATLKAETANIDLFFCGGAALARGLVAEGAKHADIAVIEGVMGYYDGAGGTTTTSSTWDMAQQLEAPAILILHARGITQTASALVAGLAGFRSPAGIAGVILNNCRPTLYKRLAPRILQDTGIPVLGYLPPREEYHFKSRNLGLFMPAELEDFDARVNALAQQMEATLDVEGLLAIARGVPPLPAGALPAVAPVQAPQQPAIAVARDEAFAFYYDENLQLLRRLGARLVPFSPLHSAALPAGIGGLYLGGGYIEVYAEALAQNQGMRGSVARAFAAGLPTLAEGGGFLYLQQAIADAQGAAQPMVGVLPGTAARGDKRARFGYITLTARQNGLLCQAGESIAAHEFHEWDSDTPGDSFAAKKPADERNWLAGVTGPHHYAGFPQLYLYSNPAFARRFVEKAAQYQAP